MVIDTPIKDATALDGPPATKPRKRQKRLVSVPASGSRVTRIKKARAYLRGPAWVPVNTNDRHAALFIVVCNLRLYHQLPAGLALTMIKEHFIPRFNEVDGSPGPFSDDEIREEYRRAGLPGVYPTLGVSDPKAIKKAARVQLRKEIWRFSRKHLAPGGSCSPRSVWQAFVTFRGGQHVDPSHFGREFAAVTGIRRKTPFGVPTYPDIHLIPPISAGEDCPRPQF